MKTETTATTYKWTNFEQCLADYQATGRVAFYYPRLHQVALNGGQRLSIREAVARMVAVLNQCAPCVMCGKPTEHQASDDTEYQCAACASTESRCGNKDEFCPGCVDCKN